MPCDRGSRNKLLEKLRQYITWLLMFNPYGQSINHQLFYFWKYAITSTILSSWVSFISSLTRVSSSASLSTTVAEVFSYVFKNIFCFKKGLVLRSFNNKLHYPYIKVTGSVSLSVCLCVCIPKDLTKLIWFSITW